MRPELADNWELLEHVNSIENRRVHIDRGAWNHFIGERAPKVYISIGEEVFPYICFKRVPLEFSVNVPGWG